ncbi:MAG TPA: valine--tRNA ligase [Acidimicrobiales bacterium]|nr:valine--tRNA ligase [Acidimicrobiales bacterium]
MSTDATGAPQVPEKPSIDGVEARWAEAWDKEGTYRFDPKAQRHQVFSIDTPPPTVSGSLHMGSVFGYVQTDALARYRRMRGLQVFYPMGWDDNGLPTERRVQTYFGVRCDPSLPFDPGFVPPEEPGKEDIPVSRPNFIALCHQLTAEDEVAFEALWRRLGLSVDWTLGYATIDDRSRRASQRMFLRNLGRGEAYSSEAPTLWDVDDQTAVAQAEMEDRERPGAYHRLRFDDIEIETTRPELVAACVALVAHPDDERFTARFGTTVHTPVFGVEVPVVAHELADPEKGSGIAMICTFGDVTDVIWWRELQLPIRSIVTRAGRITESPPTGVPDGPAWRAIAGSTIKAAQRTMVELLTESGDLIGEPRPITHPVKFYERGSRPLEIVTSRQWYLRNGGRDLPLREALLQRGHEVQWHPPYMEVRFENWVNGLNSDWLVSRQRFFGVPIPVWYPLGTDGETDYAHPIVPAEAALPIDPTTDVPPGFEADQRGRPGGFTGDPDVMDTWATSSVTPQIACGWEDDPALFAATFPMDLRPQGHEIIRTWFFATTLRSHLEHGSVPWHATNINGWVLDPDHKKMSKSKGNVITPMPLVEEFGSDAVRYWACNGRPGTDTAVDTGVMKIGRRLGIKILNASKFALGRLGQEAAPGPDAVSEPIDHSLLAQLAEVITKASAAFEEFDYARAQELTESFFWSFCDDYVELVKTRAYGEGGPGAASARATLALALSVQLRLFAPFVPFVTEEVWRWWQPGSVHRAAWPTVAELGTGVGADHPDQSDHSVLTVAASVLGAVRRAKTTEKRSMRARVAELTVEGPADLLAAVEAARGDLVDAGGVESLILVEAEAFSVAVVLAED